MYPQGKKLLSSKENRQCFINDLLLHIPSMPVVRVDGVLAISPELDGKYIASAAKPASYGGLRKQRAKGLFCGG